MYSPSMPIAPEAANPVVDTTVMVVSLLLIAPFKVVEAAISVAPPQPPAPQPVSVVKISSPIEI
jgi:hypothetical protein